MKDTLNTRFDMDAEIRDMMLEEGKITDITRVARNVGMTCQVAITNGLFKELYPFAEDATKGCDWQTIVEDFIKLFKKEFGTSNIKKSYAEFNIKTKTYIKKVIDFENVETFKDGKPRDKILTIYVGWIPDRKKRPSLLFGLKSDKILN